MRRRDQLADFRRLGGAGGRHIKVKSRPVALEPFDKVRQQFRIVKMAVNCDSQSGSRNRPFGGGAQNLMHPAPDGSASTDVVRKRILALCLVELRIVRSINQGMKT